MKAIPLFFLGAAAFVFGGFLPGGVLPEAEADVIRRAMYINSGGEPVYDYVFQADRCNVRSWRRSYRYQNDAYYAPPYFGSSYGYPVHSYYRPVYARSYPIYGGHHYGGYRGYHGGFHAHGSFSVGGLRVHVRF